MSKMGSHYSFGHLKHKLWAKEGPGVELPGVCQFWLPTTNSRESTRNTGLQTTCDISLESSRTRATTLLQTALRSEVCSQSYAASKLRESWLAQFRDSHAGIPRESRESRDKNAISMWAPWSNAEYTIGSKVVAYSRGPGRGESCVKVPVACPQHPRVSRNVN
jgi:hypothetical protein